MNYIYFLLICILLISTTNYFQHKLNFLLDIDQKHKIKLSRKIPLSGGIYILSTLILSKIFLGADINKILIICLSLFFILGFFSDTKPSFKPLPRLLLQLFLIILFIKLSDLSIYKTNIFFIDKFISITTFNIIFTAICLLVFLNGSNFIDGVNGNLIGYYIIILFFLTPYYYEFNLLYLLIIFCVFYFFNLFGKCYLGDNGVYVISILMSLIVIEIININSLNPIIALNMLWYPAFENLFSIIRRYIYKSKIEVADKKHLHTLLFIWIRSLKLNTNLSNSLSGFTINFFNLISIFLSIYFINNNQMLVIILISNIALYLVSYFKLLNIFSNLSDSKT